MTCFLGYFLTIAAFLPFECVGVRVDVPAFCRLKCQTEQRGLNVLISDGGL